MIVIDGKRIVFFSVVCCTVLFFVYMTLHENKELSHLAQHGNLKHTATSSLGNPTCRISYGAYSGNLWTKSDETVGRTCLLESKRMRVDHHSRKLPDGNIIDDWLWIDYGDRVNVLVRERGSNSESGKFIVFEQTKYALEGSSLAVVGGFIEPNESSENAALREVQEELQLHCDAKHLKVNFLLHSLSLLIISIFLQALGTYRTDVNRGLGWVHGFLVEDCVHVQNRSGDLVADADSKQESQSMRRLSLEQLEEAVVGAQFVEVQWTAAVALALLHLRREQRSGHDDVIRTTNPLHSMS
jgi:ADP-ribose pyrophosphatase